MSPQTPLVNVVIPVYERPDCVGRAIDGALAQSWPNLLVTVIDDGSRDATWRAVERRASDPRLVAVRLGRNVGTARAKNVGLALVGFDAITFHDSDDAPMTDKILLQARALARDGLTADPVLDWESLGTRPGAPIEVDVVVGAHRLVKMDGSVHLIENRISLIDDFFPNVQLPSRTWGDWCLINSALFRRRVFTSLGGFLDSIEEDREIRNRSIAAGCVYHFVSEPLLTKIEMNDSLTVAEDTNYLGARRGHDRSVVWQRRAEYRRGLFGPAVAERHRVAIDLADLEIVEVLRPELLSVADDLPMTAATRLHLAVLLGSPAPRPRTEERPRASGAAAEGD